MISSRLGFPACTPPRLSGRSIVGSVLVVSQHSSTTSRFVDRPVCVTGGTICPGWTPLHVNVLRAVQVVSMWMFLEMMPLRDIIRECNTFFASKPVLVLQEVLRLAPRIAFPRVCEKLQTCGFFELEHLCLASSYRSSQSPSSHFLPLVGLKSLQPPPLSII